ncbi:MAG: hypothetical protein V4525_03870 [Pseudomonadota bacterium]
MVKKLLTAMLLAASFAGFATQASAWGGQYGGGQYGNGSNSWSFSNYCSCGASTGNWGFNNYQDGHCIQSNGRW